MLRGQKLILTGLIFISLVACETGGDTKHIMRGRR
jgi:hypothetical protein